MNVYPLESTSAEKIPVTINTSSDPTGSSVSFALTTTATEPSSFQNGEWSGTWNTTTGKIDALTPLAGNGQTLDVTPGTDYFLWARWTVGTETPTTHCGTVRVS